MSQNQIEEWGSLPDHCTWQIQHDILVLDPWKSGEEEHMEARTAIVKAALANGATIHIEATALGGEEEVAFTLPPFQAVTDAIEGIAEFWWSRPCRK